MISTERSDLYDTIGFDGFRGLAIMILGQIYRNDFGTKNTIQGTNNPQPNAFLISMLCTSLTMHFWKWQIFHGTVCVGHKRFRDVATGREV